MQNLQNEMQTWRRRLHMHPETPFEEVETAAFVAEKLREMGLEVEEPQGAFYMFIDIRKFGMDSVTFCIRMLKEGLVGLIPGIYFGTEGFMRLSYCYSDQDLNVGLDRVERFLQSL